MKTIKFIWDIFCVGYFLLFLGGLTAIGIALAIFYGSFILGVMLMGASITGMIWLAGEVFNGKLFS